MNKKEFHQYLESEVYAPSRAKDLRGLLSNCYVKCYNTYLSDEKTFLYLVRKMQYLWSQGGRIQKLRAELLHKKILHKYGCCIHPNAIIGIGFHVPHPIGIVIGSKSIIGSNVTLYQGVTIGSSVDAGSEVASQPEIGDNVIVYAHSMVLGG